MKTYTYNETPDIEILESLPFKYEMSLNRDDMMAVIHALQAYSQTSSADDADRSADLRQSILTTIEIEEI